MRNKDAIPLSYLVFEKINWLYIHAFRIYKPLYYIYKLRSDRKKIRFLKKHICPGMSALDIGANIGFYTTLLSRLVGQKGKVYSFEPNAENVMNLKKSTRNRNNVIINQRAVGRLSGQLNLFMSNNLNVDHQTYDIGAGRSAQSVGAVSIDDYFRNGETVDIVKLDIQGFDYYALKGMEKTIARSKNVLLICELWPYGLKKAGTLVEDYLLQIKTMGFRLQLPDGETCTECVHKTEDKYYYTDVIAVKEA
ncbi:MAG: FkbM family methyltransferase [Chitinivibrionales bacterium]|nr:FkbM family methyltransferase [Chitinivibrionales bacterium]